MVTGVPKLEVLAPVLIAYWYEVIVDPPLLPGTNVTINEVPFKPAVIFVIVGAPGTVKGVEVTELDDAPDPEALLARSTTVYAIPLLKPVINTGDVVEPLAIHVDPLLIE
jgi:hypothetical protein